MLKGTLILRNGPRGVFWSHCRACDCFGGRTRLSSSIWTLHSRSSCHGWYQICRLDLPIRRALCSWPQLLGPIVALGRRWTHLRRGQTDQTPYEVSIHLGSFTFGRLGCWTLRKRLLHRRFRRVATSVGAGHLHRLFADWAAFLGLRGSLQSLVCHYCQYPSRKKVISSLLHSSWNTVCSQYTLRWRSQADCPCKSF